MELFYVTKEDKGDEVVIDQFEKAADACKKALERIRAGEQHIAVMGTERGIIAFQNTDGHLESTGQ